MGNLLTPGLLAAAMTAAINIGLGADAMSWNVFLAAAVAFLLCIDCGDSRVAEGGPAAHSIGGALAITYLAGIAAYALTVLSYLSIGDAAMAVLAVGAGTAAHLLSEAAIGKTVYTIPRTLDPLAWFEEAGPGTERFWDGWGRFRAAQLSLGDTHLNAASVAAIIGCIWLG